VIIEFIYEIIHFKLKDEVIYREWLCEIAEKENRIIGSLKFIFVDEERINKINRKFLKHFYTTDIITFDSSFLNTISGEVYISVPTVQKNSILYSKGIFEKEINRVIVHGVLHLIGYNDKSEDELRSMRLKEDQYLKYLD
jgi:probable rRNA maturation factor